MACALTLESQKLSFLALEPCWDSIDTISMHYVNISVSQSVKSLGVTLDSSLSSNQHVNNLCKSSYFHIWALWHIRKYLYVEDAKSIATAMAPARLDYCNSVLYDTSQMNINKLQRVQNMLACTVVQARKYDHVTLILAELHWLPLEARR